MKIERKVRMAVPAPMAKEMPGVQIWQLTLAKSEWRAILSRDEIAPGDTRWHLSIAGQNATPPWNVIAAVAHELRPGVPLAMGVPPRSQWMNIHPHTLHLFEIKDANLLAQWRFEGRGDLPS